MDEYIAETESGNRKKLRIGKIFQACVKDPTRRDLVASKKNAFAHSLIGGDTVSFSGAISISRFN